MNHKNNSPGSLSMFSSRAEVEKWANMNLERIAQNRMERDDAGGIQETLKHIIGIDTERLAPLDMKTVSIAKESRYTVRNILFQSQLGIYVPANLYVPEGDGPFPAVLNSHGHWDGGKCGEIVQETAQRLVQSGYVVLCMDAWGAGERGTGHTHEYHGAHLGGALLDIGESLIGLQLLDNFQGVNLLCSLPFVDSTKIGAVGASGGGNQTMWIGALDQRIQAVVLVVSVGTLGRYILQSNCMCELLPSGLEYFETHDVLSAIAPRAVKIFSVLREVIPAFKVESMLEVFARSGDAFRTGGGEDNLSYELFDSTHDFTPEMQLAMLAFFQKMLPLSYADRRSSFAVVDQSKLKVLGDDNSYELVTTTLDLVRDCASRASARLTERKELSKNACQNELKGLLSLTDRVQLISLEEQGERGLWKYITLMTNDEQTIPVSYSVPVEGKKISIVLSMAGAGNVENEDEYLVSEDRAGIVLMDLFGVGIRQVDEVEALEEGLPRFHTFMRTFSWLGESLMGRWVTEIKLLIDVLQEKFPGQEIEIVADRDMALAALFFTAIYGRVDGLELKESILSILPVENININKSLSMAIHIPGIITWGDVSLITALVSVPVKYEGFIDMAGNILQGTQIEEFHRRVDLLKSKIVK